MAACAKDTSQWTQNFFFHFFFSSVIDHIGHLTVKWKELFQLKYLSSFINEDQILPKNYLLSNKNLKFKPFFFPLFSFIRSNYRRGLTDDKYCTHNIVLYMGVFAYMCSPFFLCLPMFPQVKFSPTKKKKLFFLTIKDYTYKVNSACVKKGKRPMWNVTSGCETKPFFALLSLNFGQRRYNYPVMQQFLKGWDSGWGGWGGSVCHLRQF